MVYEYRPVDFSCKLARVLFTDAFHVYHQKAFCESLLNGSFTKFNFSTFKTDVKSLCGHKSLNIQNRCICPTK